MSGTLDILFPYQATTHDITVRVSVSFLADQSEPAKSRWFWTYHIRVENKGAAPVQLMSRRWIITDGRGERHRVEGDGVVGAQPIIDPGACYDYVSGCPLDTPTGAMEGHYRMIGEDGDSFEVRIPRFELREPAMGA